MRVTNKMVTSQVLYNISNTTSKYLNLQSIASSGRRINRPSDDPLGITKDLLYRSRLANIDQYNLNVTYAQSWLEYSDSSMSEINDLIISAKELAVELANDTYDENSRITAATEIEEMFNQIVEAGNAQYQGKYIFSGSKTNTAALFANAIGVIYQGDYQSILAETETDSYLNINSFASDFLTTQISALGTNADINPGLQGNLWLTSLNGGEGIEMGAGEIVVNTVNGSYTVDIGTANPRNVQQVLDAINAAGIPNLTASIAESGSGIQLTDTSASHITVDTPLSMLNSGNGVDLSPGTFTIRTSDSSITASINISGDTDMDEVLTDINTQLAAAGITNVTASIDPTDNKIVFTDTNAVPYELVIENDGDSSTASDLGITGTFTGEMIGEDLEPLHIQVQESATGETLAASLGLLQSATGESIVGTDLNPQLTYNTLLSSLNSNSGIDFGVITISNGQDSIDLDLGTIAANPNATINDVIELINNSGIGAKAYLNENRTGFVVESEYDDRTFIITEGDDGRTASALGILGSSDLLGNMMVLQQALERNNVEEIEATLEIFDTALDSVLTARSSVGAREIRANNAESRLTTQQLLVTEQLSQVEDADLVQLAIDLASSEVMYQSALAAAANVIQPTLMDFLG